MQSPKHRLTAVYRKSNGVRLHSGWNKKINRKATWVCSAADAPTGEEADVVYESRMSELWTKADDKEQPGDAVTVKLVANLFVERKKRAGIHGRTLGEYSQAITEFMEVVGKTASPGALEPKDFAKVRQRWDARFGPDRLAKFIINIRSMFKWARKPPLRQPEPDYGDEFNQPGRRAFKKHRATDRQKHGLKLFDQAEIAKLLAKATVKVKAMVLLGLNGGLGNTDIAELPLALIDLDSGWLDYARGKTGNDRRFPLWPETVVALRAVMKSRDMMFGIWANEGRKVNPSVADLLFVTRQARPYIFDKPSAKDPRQLLHKDGVANAFTKLCDAASAERHGRGFYSLRRTFRTLADEAGDQRAAAFVMGHEQTDMGGIYVQRISNERIQRVTDYVRSKLIQSDPVPATTSPAPPSKARAKTKP